MKFTSTALCLLAFALPTFAAETVHLTLRGSVQGPIYGDSTQTSLGRDGTIECVGYSHMLSTEPDPRSGLTSEIRYHFPLSIVKRFDKSSPRLFQAWKTRENLTATFKFYRPNPAGDGTTQQFYIVTLEGAAISGIRQEVLNTMDPGTSNVPPIERVSFTYERIYEYWVPEKFEAYDNWRTKTGTIPFSDLNFDGVINMKDYAILADDWLLQY